VGGNFRSAYVDVGEVAQRDRDRQIWDYRIGGDKPAKGRGAQRLQFVHRPRLRRQQWSGEFLRAEPDAYDSEVGVTTPPLPQPAAARRGPQRLRIRVPVIDSVALLPDRAAHLGPELAEPAHVLPPRIHHVALALPAH